MLTCGRSLPSSLDRAFLPAGLSPTRRIGLRGKKFSNFISLCGMRKEAFWPLDCRRRSPLLAPGAFNSDADSMTKGSVKKRNIVEHIFLLKAKSDISEDEENNMLDYLYTSQYQMRGILAISLGHVTDSNVDGFTHALFMRFQKKEDLAKFYGNSYHVGVLKEHVMPYCYEFNYGVEFLLLISISKNALNDAVEDAFTTLQALIDEFNSMIIQATHGFNFNHTDSEYTHGAVIRFPSLEALELFRGSSEYKDMWRRKFKPLAKKVLAIHFLVDPVGTELM